MKKLLWKRSKPSRRDALGRGRERTHFQRDILLERTNRRRDGRGPAWPVEAARDSDAQQCRIGPSCGGSPREGARSEAEQRLAAGGAQRSTDPNALISDAAVGSG